MAYSASRDVCLEARVRPRVSDIDFTDMSNLEAIIGGAPIESEEWSSEYVRGQVENLANAASEMVSISERWPEEAPLGAQGFVGEALSKAIAGCARDAGTFGGNFPSLKSCHDAAVRQSLAQVSRLWPVEFDSVVTVIRRTQASEDRALVGLVMASAPFRR